jgi:hypothetical protein
VDHEWDAVMDSILNTFRVGLTQGFLTPDFQYQ